jgi:hypothetical protein
VLTRSIPASCLASGSGAVTPAVEAAAAPVAPAAKPQGGRGKKDWKTSRSIKTRTITEADIANGHAFSIFDVVMPIPGFDVDLPGGKLRDMYEKILAADGLDAEGSWKKQKSGYCPSHPIFQRPQLTLDPFRSDLQGVPPAGVLPQDPPPAGRPHLAAHPVHGPGCLARPGRRGRHP